MKHSKNIVVSSNRKKKFAVIAILDEKNPAKVFTTLAESHDVACHQVEIANGWGDFIALNKNQARNVYSGLKNHLQDW